MQVLKALLAFVIMTLGLILGVGGGCGVGIVLASATGGPEWSFVIAIALGVLGAVAGLLGAMALAHRLTGSREP